jgi:hypothetical protein
MPFLAIFHLHDILFVCFANTLNIVFMIEDENLKSIVEFLWANFIISVGIDLLHCSLYLWHC